MKYPSTKLVVSLLVLSCLYFVRAEYPAEDSGHATPTHAEANAPAEAGHGTEEDQAEGSGHATPTHGAEGGNAEVGHGTEGGEEEEHECEEHEEEGGAVGLLTLMNHFSDDTAIIWIIVGLLIIVNFVWEFVTDGLEHFFMESKREHIVIMLEKLYKGNF